jgi:hypothetical protein
MIISYSLYTFAKFDSRLCFHLPVASHQRLDDSGLMGAWRDHNFSLVETISQELEARMPLTNRSLERNKAVDRFAQILP